VGPWNVPGAPGRFQLFINNIALDTTFGTEGEPWHWQNGGLIRLKKGESELLLHDLTGFEGRCDAILLNTIKDLSRLMKKQNLQIFEKLPWDLTLFPEMEEILIWLLSEEGWQVAVQQ
jgi:hypothetical protein